MNVPVNKNKVMAVGVINMIVGKSCLPLVIAVGFIEMKPFT